MRNLNNNRCALCGSFIIFKDGEIICPKCNCTISESEYYEPSDELYENSEVVRLVKE